MKNKLYALVLILVVGNMISCQKDFLKDVNKTGQTADLTYQTKTGMEGLIASSYSFARGWYGKEAGRGLSEMGTGLFYYGYDKKEKSWNAYHLTRVSREGNARHSA